MSENKEKTGQISELETQLLDCQDALQNLVFQKSMQQLEDISQIKKNRKKIARIKTLITEAKAFPKLNPTDKQTTNPGPAVDATASILSMLILLSSIAFFTIQSILSICDLAANSGTTPPNFLCISS